MIEALTIVSEVRNNLWDWQSLSPTSGGGVFFEFCDALEVENGTSAGPEGFGLDHALEAWGSFWNATYYALSPCMFTLVLLLAHDVVF